MKAGSQMKTVADVSRHFHKHFNGQKNIFTDRVLGYGLAKNNLEWELSKGELFGEDLYGVTVLKVEAGEIESQNDLSKAFRTELEATEYIATL
jgi:hypothetical protein